MSLEERYFAEENDFCAPVLKFITQILMEEELEAETRAFQDSLALHATEKSFDEVLGEKCPISPTQFDLHQNSRSIDDSVSRRDCTSNSCMTPNVDESGLIFYLGQPDLSQMKAHPVESTIQSNSQSPCPSSNSHVSVDGTAESSFSTSPVPGLFGENLESQRRTKEAGDEKFPPGGNCFVIDFENNKFFSLEPEERILEVEAEQHERNSLLGGLRGPHKHHQEESDLEEGRSNKYLMVDKEVSEEPEMFDQVLLYNGGHEDCALSGTAKQDLQNGMGGMLTQNVQSKGQNGVATVSRRRIDKREVVDLRTLLSNCAQAVASNDSKGATELLKKIRQYSSPFSDGFQRLSHYFANGFEARLAGTGSQVYKNLVAKRSSATDMLRAYRLYLLSCPFMMMSNFVATQTVMEVSDKATRLHLIHFGIQYGFQLPSLIQRLSRRSGGPPKLRITGIDHPQPGFRPAAGVEETGGRLARYCKRFNVPFEYNAIAQKWETIQIEDLKIEREEVLVVTCLYRFRHILDETVVSNSPRDAVLNLIKTINPDIFIHGIINGAYDTPFFFSRFREALYYYDAVFDVLEANVESDDWDRVMFEKEIYGREILNIIACEGSERVERPETYKQWQIRNQRAGLRQLPLNQNILKKVRAKVKFDYHRDYLVGEDNRWLLFGWKGRILYALSCWKPA